MSYSKMGFQTLSTDLPNGESGTPHGSHGLAAGSAWISELDRDGRQVAWTDGCQSQAAPGPAGRHDTLQVHWVMRRGSDPSVCASPHFFCSNGGEVWHGRAIYGPF